MCMVHKLYGYMCVRIVVIEKTSGVVQRGRNSGVCLGRETMEKSNDLANVEEGHQSTPQSTQQTRNVPLIDVIYSLFQASHEYSITHK